jgi:hypothetical protein
VGARTEAVAPAFLNIELANQIQEAGGGGVEVGRQLGDLVAQPLERGDASVSGKHSRRVNLHGESPFCWGNSTPWFSHSEQRPGRPI